MFQIQKNDPIKWPVTVNIPRDGGDVTKATFTASFKVISGAQFDTIYKNGGVDEDLVRAVVSKWDGGVKDVDGNDMDFNAENLDILIAVPYVRQAFVTAYLEVSNGKAAARKN